MTKQERDLARQEYRFDGTLQKALDYADEAERVIRRLMDAGRVIVERNTNRTPDGWIAVVADAEKLLGGGS
jgi:hypothetical protein